MVEDKPILNALDACQSLLDIARIMDAQCLKRPVYAFTEIAAECRSIGYLWLNDMHIELANEPMTQAMRGMPDLQDATSEMRDVLTKDLAVRIDALWGNLSDVSDAAGLPTIALADIDLNDIRTCFSRYVQAKKDAIDSIGIDAIMQIERVAHQMLKSA